MLAACRIACLVSCFLFSSLLLADTGDPQIKTDHPWYPGELSCSTFERLFKTQAELYERVTGKKVETDHDKALASWLWRNTHYWHGEEGREDLWGEGFAKGRDVRMREYWTGLFAHGYSLCGTTHSQWVAEMEALFGQGRGRGVGVQGHNSFEVFLTGGEYGTGRWALLDHDLSTVIYDAAGKRLLSLAEVEKDAKRLAKRNNAPERQPWLVCGLHKDDGGVYQQYNVAEYLAGYAGPPPMVHLRRGERLRRYPEPGLEDGKTFVYWGRNYSAGDIPGPERSLTWVNQPEQMHQSKTGAKHKTGQARYANAVYTYEPNFANGDYHEGIIDESPQHVTFEFQTPYIIAATPADDSDWGIYNPGCKNGLVVAGKDIANVAISTDRGTTWHDSGKLDGSLDLTDQAKGFRQYWLRVGGGKKSLAASGLKITTVCQMNSSLIPRLKDGGTTITYESTGQAIVSAGPTLSQAKSALIEGSFDGPRVMLGLSTPRQNKPLAIYAAGHIASSSPPDAKVAYQIEYRLDEGNQWLPLVKDWHINRQGEEPKDFWSQSLCWGAIDIPTAKSSNKVLVRWRNDGGKKYLRTEMHLAYQAGNDPTKWTFAWTDSKGKHLESATLSNKQSQHKLATAINVWTQWVEVTPAP
jgi:hypothetical protein